MANRLYPYFCARHTPSLSLWLLFQKKLDEILETNGSQIVCQIRTWQRYAKYQRQV